MILKETEALESRAPTRKMAIDVEQHYLEIHQNREFLG
jgi:hypothetical protein